MKSRFFLLLLAVMMVTSAGASFAETLQTRDYWILKDGYTANFTGNTQMNISCGPYGTKIPDDVFHVKYPWVTGVTTQFFNYDAAGTLKVYGATFYDVQYQEDWDYIASGSPEFLPARVEVGRIYTCGYTRTEYEGGVYKGTGSDSYTISVSGPQTIKVPAGTFTVYEFRFVNRWRTSTGNTGSTSYVYHLAQGIGWIRAEMNGRVYERTSSPGPTLGVSCASLTLNPSETGSCTISGGVGPYTAVSGDLNVVQASAISTNLYYLGVSGGSTTITVSDTSGLSATVSVTVTGPPSAPVLNPASTSGTSATFTWAPVSNATGYAHYYAPVPNAGEGYDSTATDVGSGTSVTLNGFQEGQGYYWAVRAFNSSGGSPYSSIGHFVINSNGVSVSCPSLSLSVGESGQCTISGGVGPYSAVSSNSGVVQTSAGGSTLYYLAASAGSATISVWDSAGHSNAVSVSVSGGSPSTYTNSLGMTFILLPAGTFTMGSPESEPGRDSDETQHQVTLTQHFYMQQTEVTQAQWEAMMGSNPSHFSGCPTCPVETMSWDDAQTFIAYMNQRGDGTYSLPTEAQWEYAVRAGTTTAFYNGGITETGSGYDPNLNAIGW